MILSVPSRFGGKAMVETGIGYFGDERLKKNGELIVQRVAERQAVCVRKLADDRPEQVKLRRFLRNEAVTVEEMVAHRAMLVAAAAKGRPHVLAIQDTSEINYQAQSGRKHGLGTVGNGSDIGLFVHPVLAVDAQTQECLGLVDAQVWRRTKGKAPNYKSLPIEQKESYRWIEGFAEAMEIAALIPNTRVISVADREGDMFELFDFRRRQTGRKAELLIRAKTDRCLEATGHKLFEELAAAPWPGPFPSRCPASVNTYPSRPRRDGPPCQRGKLRSRSALNRWR